MLQETDWGRAEDGPAVRAADTHLRQDGSEKGGPWGEANFNCVTIEFGLEIEFFSNQSLRLLDLILTVCLLSNFGGDFDREPISAHAQTLFYQPRLRLVFEGGSGGSRGKGGARPSGHAHTTPTPPPGRRWKKVPGWLGGGWAERRRRKASQLASELSFELTNEFMPRAQCLATREGH